MRRRLTKMFLLGESALDKTIVKLLEESLRSLQDDLPDILMNDPVFAAAKGRRSLQAVVIEVWA